MTRAAVVLEVPDLADGRVRLRPWAEDDAPALVAAWRDPTILAGARPPDDRSERGARRWIEGCEVRREAGVALDLVICGLHDDAVLGEVGLSRFDSARRAALAGWWVAAPARRRGVATSGVRLLVDWALAGGALDAVLAEIRLDNVGSEKVAAACGFEVLRPGTAETAGVWVRRREGSPIARGTFSTRP